MMNRSKLQMKVWSVMLQKTMKTQNRQLKGLTKMI
jgi:hypothetical protein